MKKFLYGTALFTLFLMLSGCLTTFYPIFTEKDLVYEARLLGDWKSIRNNNDTGRILITRLSSEKGIEMPGNLASIREKGYLVSYLDKEGHPTDRYIAFLAKIGKHQYFDYYPTEYGMNILLDEFYSMHLVKMHTSYRVDLKADGTFQMDQLEGSYLNRLIEEKKIRIRHEVNRDGDIVVTAPTPELQQYLIKYGDDPEAYRNEITTYTRQ